MTFETFQRSILLALDTLKGEELIDFMQNTLDIYSFSDEHCEPKEIAE